MQTKIYIIKLLNNYVDFILHCYFYEEQLLNWYCVFFLNFNMLGNKDTHLLQFIIYPVFNANTANILAVFQEYDLKQTLSNCFIFVSHALLRHHQKKKLFLFSTRIMRSLRHQIIILSMIPWLRDCVCVMCFLFFQSLSLAYLCDLSHPLLVTVFEAKKKILTCTSQEFR